MAAVKRVVRHSAPDPTSDLDPLDPVGRPATPEETPRAGRLVLALDRLPVTLGRNGGGDDWTVLPMSGGMINALTPVLRARGGLWVGWSGVPQEELGHGCRKDLTEANRECFDLRPIELSASEVRSWYTGYANQVLWPVFHGLEEQSRTEPTFWPKYQEVNRAFAHELATLHRPGDILWIHDYQLLLVGEELRRQGIDRGVTFFLHVPFPPPELFFRLPQAERLLSALCDHDLIGLQTERHVANFLACLRRLDPKLGHHGGEPVPHHVSHPVDTEIGGRRRRFQIGAFPIGVDYYELREASRAEAIDLRAAELERRLGGARILLGVDRLDYTKGIRHKLRAFGTLLERHPEWQGKVVLLQVINPSRETVPAYAALKREIETIVGEINGTHARPGWIPIQYRYRPLDRTDLLAHYRAADVAVVTPLEDGMNLVAKEYCATGDDAGALVLSRFAGAATQLADGALLVNPWDEEGLAEAMHRALTLDSDERSYRMEHLRSAVRNEDIYHWAGTFLKAAQGTLAPGATRDPEEGPAGDPSP